MEAIKGKVNPTITSKGVSATGNIRNITQLCQTSNVPAEELV
jgi:hypothetical protein